jgi:outer membrane protein TolC
MQKMRIVFVAVASVAWPVGLRAQPVALTLPQTVQAASEKYPAVRAALEGVEAAAAGISLARASYLPRADLLGQINRATRNNVFGLLLPQSVIPSISGPVLGANDMTNVWGSAAGILVSWEPFDFGLREAKVESAESARRLALSSSVRTRFDVSTAAADAFLTVLAAHQTVRAARAGVDRARVIQELVDALVKAELRPGVDSERARAEGALAEAQLIGAEQAAEVAQASLAQLLGVVPADVEVQPGPLLQLPPEFEPGASRPEDHPLAAEQRAAVAEVQAREKTLERSYYPHFNLQAATYARGTGARTDGTTGGAFSGFGPDTANWAVGLTVTFPIMELPSLRAQRQIELHRERAEEARYRQVLQDLEGGLAKARARLEGARRIARTTPVRLEAARAAEQQAMARYRSGLATMVEVADTERLLAQAEIDDGLAKLNVWRAQLGLASASGDLTPFLKQAGR